jgi:hypothetical protein
METWTSEEERGIESEWRRGPAEAPRAHCLRDGARVRVFMREHDGGLLSFECDACGRRFQVEW